MILQQIMLRPPSGPAFEYITQLSGRVKSLSGVYSNNYAFNATATAGTLLIMNVGTMGSPLPGTFPVNAGGNTWTQVVPHTDNNAGSIWACVLSAPMSSVVLDYGTFASGTIGHTVLSYKVPAGKTVALAKVNTTSSNTASTLTALVGREYLFMRTINILQSASSFIPTSGYTSSGLVPTENNNRHFASEFLIGTGTSATSFPTMSATPYGKFAALYLS